MLRVIAVVLAVGLSASDIAAADKYTSKDGKYSIVFPAAPKESPPNEVEAPVGKIKLFTSSLDVKKDLAFLVVYNDYPADVAKAPPHKILEAVRDGSKGATGKIVDDKATAFGDTRLPARDYIIDKGGNFYRARIILDGTRLYQIIAVGRNIKDVTEEADKFVASFAIEK